MFAKSEDCGAGACDRAPDVCDMYDDRTALELARFDALDAWLRDTLTLSVINHA